MEQDKIISGGNEICFDRHSVLIDVIEQIDPFFDYHLVVVNGTTVDRIDRLTVDRNTIKLKEKHSSKNQWTFLGDDGTEYTVFSPESSDFLSNPGLSELVLVREIMDDSSSESSECSNSGSSSGSGTHSEDCHKKKKKDKDKPNKSEKSSSDNDSDILSEGWTEDGSSSELYRKNNVSPPETIETDESMVFKLNTGSTTLLL